MNSSHPLYQLADKIDWAKFDTAFEPLYSQNNGRPGKPIRLMCGLLILKYLGNLSDEFIVEQWSENAYYQYLFGMQEFTSCAPAPLLNTFVLKRIYRDQRFRNHPKNRKKALKADKKLRTIAGRLVRELKRNLGADSRYTGLIERFEAILSQRRNSRKKIYSIHEPEVQCISKGKEYKKYEFGNKGNRIKIGLSLSYGCTRLFF